MRYFEDDVFHYFGVPECVVTDNGVQLKAFYSLQPNASEKVNMSVLSAIKAYIDPS